MTSTNVVTTSVQTQPVHLSTVGVTFLVIAVVLFLALIVWTLYWKIKGMWRAARNGHKGWFAFFMFINLLGIPKYFI